MDDEGDTVDRLLKDETIYFCFLLFLGDVVAAAAVFLDDEVALTGGGAGLSSSELESLLS